MLRSILSALLFCLATAVECVLLGWLISEAEVAPLVPLWLLLHAGASVAASIGILGLMLPTAGRSSARLFCLCLVWSLCLPCAGLLGAAATLLIGVGLSRKRHHAEPYWQMTRLPSLPFTTPFEERSTHFDARGFIEQLRYSGDHSDLYNKVLAAGKSADALSIGILKQAIGHADERIRLTAYQSLDKRVTALNSEIQKLEASAREASGDTASRLWFQVTGNYAELLTLEEDEPVARAQLLDKVTEASRQALHHDPANRNAALMLGKALLAQGQLTESRTAFDAASTAGLSKQKILPYLAELAFRERRFWQVGKLLAEIEPAYRKAASINHVTAYWK